LVPSTEPGAGEVKAGGAGNATWIWLDWVVRFSDEVRARVAVSVSLVAAAETAILLKLADPDARVPETVPLRAAGLPDTDTGLAAVAATTSLSVN
jgi:hypothetical protein